MAANGARARDHRRTSPDVRTDPGAWALEVLHDAGRAAARKGAPAAALRYLRQAVEVADTDELAARVLIDVGLAEAAAGEPTSLDRFEQALNLLSEPAERADALYSLGRTLYRFGPLRRRGVAFRRGAQLFEGGDQQLRLRFEGAALSAETHLTPTGRGPEGVVDGDGPGTRAILAVQALRAVADHTARRLGRRSRDPRAWRRSAARRAGFGRSQCQPCHPCAAAMRAADRSARCCGCHPRATRESGARTWHSPRHRWCARSSCTRAVAIIDAAADAQAALDGMRHQGHSNAQSALATLVHCMIERGDVTQAANLLGGAGGQLAPTPAINAYVCLARGRTAPSTR